MSLAYLALAFLGLIALLLALAIYRTRSMAAQAVKLVAQEGQIIEVGGGSVHYVDLGPKDAQPLVMIHGLSGQLQHFTYAVTDLLSDDFRVIVVDRPGCGYSTRDNDDLASPAEQARMIGEALDILDVDHPVLVGHSLGGAVALAMALDRPERTGALALICPATQAQDETPEVFKGLQVESPVLRRVIGHTIAVPLAAATADKVLAMVFHPEPCPSDFMLRAGAALGLRPQAFITASADVMALRRTAEQQVARYETELKTPGGILYGAADAILSPTLHGHTMKAFGLECELLENRGHMIPMTAAADCAEFIRRMAAKAT